MSIIKHVTLQKIVARDFRYDPRNIALVEKVIKNGTLKEVTVACFRVEPLHLTGDVHENPKWNGQ